MSRSAPPLRILALEPWLGGSHRAFLEQWRARTVHELVVLGLPARRWRWRMAAGAWELARRVEREGLARPDVIFVSDYVDLVSLYGWLPPSWGAPPALLYLHESQLVYPAPEDEHDSPAPPSGRELHWAFLNMTSVLRARMVVFNSRFHREAFARAGEELLARLPRPAPRRELADALAAARVIAPGIELESFPLGPGASGPLRAVFNHRFEHDKDPRAFLEAARAAVRAGAELELVLCGERFERTPPGVDALLEELRPLVVHDGWAPELASYAALMALSDVVVSTARHEFYGLSVLEALAAGCTPLLPRRLVYPELVSGTSAQDCLYDSPGELAERLTRLAAEPGPVREATRRAQLRALAERHGADASARALDAACAELGTGA